jgi:hypothetical protein
MKSLLIRLGVLTSATVMALATQLNAVPLGISASFGAVDPGTPANATSESNFINNLRGISPAGENAPSFPPSLDDGTFLNTGGTLYDRFNTVIPSGPAASTTNSIQGVTSGNTLNLGAVGSWSYLLAKFGNTSYVWFVGAMGGAIELDASLGSGGGLSHYSLYTPGTTVPDGGTTVALIGLALGVLAIARRKLAV